MEQFPGHKQKEPTFMEEEQQIIDKNSARIKEDPEDVWARSELADALCERKKTGDEEKAVRIYKKIIETDPTFERAHNGLADALLSLGKTEEAIEAYKEGIAIDSKYFNLYDGLGDAYLKLGKKEEALDAYRKYVEFADSAIVPFFIKMAKEKIEKLEKGEEIEPEEFEEQEEE